MEGLNENNSLIVPDNINHKIHAIRGVQVMLDSDLAELYGVSTGRLNEAVKRNIDRFPEDFMFQLTQKECEILKSQFAISSLGNVNNFPVNTSNNANRSISQFAISKNDRGGRQKLPFVFTEQGVAMLSGVLKSERAIKVNIFIMRAFVAMRQFIQENAGLFQRVDSLEIKQIKTDKNIKMIFSAMADKNIFKKQKILFDNQIFDAYKFVNDILKKAKKSIILIDNYIDESVLILFSEIKNVKIIIYTENITDKLKLDLEKYNQQYSNIEIRKFKKCHDRFLIIDNKEIYHFGASIKDLGKKWFAFSKMDKESLKLLQKLE
ncbi:MAG TPA: ORF6N domain-containing protein [archaeon]|nr:ORF6N domain-containing protein [archaeon]